MKHIALKITAFIFGIALWLYVVSLNTFKVELDIPVRLVKLPEMLAIASKPPHTMRITLEGAPFDLMRLRSKVMQGDTTAAAIIVDLQDAELGATRKPIGEKNFSAPNFSNIKFIEPDNQLLFIDLDLDTRIERNVPVRSMVTFDAATGYLLTDEPKLEPDFITVSGARNVITRIIEIPTDSVSFSGLVHDTTYSIPLDFEQFPAHVSPGDSLTSISVNIQKIGKKFYRDIPVQLIGMFDRETYRLNPPNVSVEITGGEVTRGQMMSALSIGVGISIGLSVIRIYYDFSLLYYLIPGYAISLGLSFLVPRLYTAIAFDSGGVASGPLTSSFILPMVVGACMSMQGQSKVLELAFGVVAMVAMTPLITIQCLGFKSVLATRYRRKAAFRRILAAADDPIIYFE